jgi:cyclopropane-fatty-acyl-phospholipid synthase
MAVQLRAEHFTPAPPPADDPAARITRAALALLFGPPERRGFAVRLWDGGVEGPANPAPFTLVLRHAGALRRMFTPTTELNLAESYLRDDFDVEGDMERAVLLGDQIALRLRSARVLARLPALLLRLPRKGGKHLRIDARARTYGRDRPLPAFLRLPHYVLRHTRRRDAETQAFSYDTSNAFYRLWLDEQYMQYTCAYFRTGTEDLCQAQQAKMEHICRKLRLRPGQRLLDIGCGWGGLLRYAVEHYGVTGYGVTLSAAQAEWANESFARGGIADRVRVDVRDYRALPLDESWDRLTGVGVIEHTGVANIARLYARVHGLLKPGGLFLNQFIVCLFEPPARSGDVGSGRILRQHNAFIQKYIFPDAEMPTITEAVASAERVGFEVRDVESLREHYATTFRHWLRRLEARADEARAIVGEEAYRAFRLYLAAFPPRFEGRWSGLTQVLMSKPLADGRALLPPSRDDVYRDAAGSLAR